MHGQNVSIPEPLSSSDFSHIACQEHETIAQSNMAVLTALPGSQRFAISTTGNIGMDHNYTTRPEKAQGSGKIRSLLCLVLQPAVADSVVR
jgi:hypothetical protein